MVTPTPKPQPPKKVLANSQEPEKAPVKKPFIPKPHLTHNAFREHDDLKALQRELNKSRLKRKPSVTAKKTQEK